MLMLMTNSFLSCDWGTSQFRLRLVAGPDARVLGEVRSDDGVGRLVSAAADESRAEVFRSTLAAKISALAQEQAHMPKARPVVISGMASSTIGWTELPYATLPFKLDGSDMIWKDLGLLRVNKGSYQVILLSGIRGEEEIMRGEETQVVGLTRTKAGRLLQEETIVVLPGTHSKHVHVQGGRIVDFETYLTGECFEMLSRHSVLKHSVTPPQTADSQATVLAGPGRDAFEAGVKAAGSAPLLRQLFRVRTRQVLRGCSQEENRAFLSGLLIGAEISGLLGRCAGSVPVILCAGELLSKPYEIAWQMLGAKERLQVLSCTEVERLCVLGHAVVLDHMKLRGSDHV